MEWIVSVPAGVLVGALAITTTHCDAADSDFPGDADRLESPAGVGDVHPNVRQRSPRRDGVSLGQPRDAGDDSGLSGAVGIPDRSTTLQERPSQPVGERLAD